MSSQRHRRPRPPQAERNDMMTPVFREGWGYPQRRQSRSHYFRGGKSLCQKVGLYHGRLEDDMHAVFDECAHCRKIVDKEKVA